MRIKSFLLAISVALLVSCSNSSGGGGGGGNIFDPTLKPANAVSNADFQYYMSLLKISQRVIPADEVIFSKVLNGSTAKDVTKEEREEASKRLSTSGQQVARDVLSNCTVNEAKTKTTGGDEFKQGAKIVESGAMSITQGFTCPMMMDKQVETTSVVRTILESAGGQEVRVVSDILSKETQSRDFAGASIRKGTNASKFGLNVTTTGVIDLNISKSSVTMAVTMNGIGSIAYDLADGDFARGPVGVKINLDSAAGKGSVQYLLDLKTSRGAIRIVALSDETKQEVYINGEKQNPENFPDIMSSMNSIVANIPSAQVMASKFSK